MNDTPAVFIQLASYLRIEERELLGEVVYRSAIAEGRSHRRR